MYSLQLYALHCQCYIIVIFTIWKDEFKIFLILQGYFFLWIGIWWENNQPHLNNTGCVPECSICIHIYIWKNGLTGGDWWDILSKQ